MRLLNKVAVITGAGSGMGKAMATMFAAEGARVVCADISGMQRQVAAAIGHAAVAVHTDVAVEDDVQNMITTAEKTFGKLDILINNAGFGGGTMPLHEQTTENWDRVHSVNLKGVFMGMKYGLISMRKNGAGAIVNIASAAGLVGFKGHSIYGAAKAGVIHMTKAAALDYAANNIRINAICPGITWTGLIKKSQEYPSPPPGMRPSPGVPMNRYGLASEIAAAALFLASDEAGYITGVALPVDGGYSIGFSGMGAEHV